MITRRTRRHFVALSVLLSIAVAAVALGDRLIPRLIRGAAGAFRTAVFEVPPYLQPGEAPGAPGSSPESLALLWQTADRDAAWSVDLRTEPGGAWVNAKRPTFRRIRVDGVSPFRLYRTNLDGLKPAGAFAYRVARAGKVVFEAGGTARKPPGQPHRFVVFGDGGAGTAGQSAVAYQTFQARPDYVVITGDVVYMRGRVSEYIDKFFPVYNDDSPSVTFGTPLLRSTLFLPAAGNHDLVERDLDLHHDGLAFFYYWALPLNGPDQTAGYPPLKGTDARRQAFLDAAGPAFPKMVNYSYDYGDVHWTVIDANTYADWTDPTLLSWLEADLASAAGAAWRLVAFHQPGFNSSKAHGDDQRMRLLAPVFEKAGVAVVFSGHVHNYQRSHPLKFAPAPPPVNGGGKPYGPGGTVDGVWTLDKAYDGRSRTHPDGVIYVVTGAGGARLYNSEQGDDPASWQEFTAKFVSRVHSLTVVDVSPKALSVRQVSADGAELDRFVVSRAGATDRYPEPGPPPQTGGSGN